MAERNHHECFVSLVRGDDSILSIHHNLIRGKQNENVQQSTQPVFDVKYVHEQPFKKNEFFEIRIDDFGDLSDVKDKGDDKYPIIFGIGIGCPESKEFLYGVNVDSQKNMVTTDGSCLFRFLDEGDVIRVQATEDAILIKYGESILYTAKVDPNDGYKLFIGMQKWFQRVTLMCNKSFASQNSANPEQLSKNKMRLLVTSMNEGSPRYGKDVAWGGQHLLMDGMLVRRLSEENIKIVNYSPGSSSFVYDAKAAADYDLPDMLPPGLIRIRVYLAGNELTIRRMHTHNHEEYNVHLLSKLTGMHQVFHGTAHDWIEQRNQLLSHGEKYLINLPNAGGVQSYDLKIAGTKCKTICHTVGESLTWRVGDDGEVPTVVLLGGDRSQSIGSIIGAREAYEDLCLLYFDAHFDMRDPNASQYPLVHGSPLFFLLGQKLRDAIKKLPADIETNDSQIGCAIRYLRSTEEGTKYWNDLKDPYYNGYRGFEWMEDSKKIDPKRIAFVGMRSKTWEAGSSLGGPLPMLFKNILKLDGQMHTSEDVRCKGVTQVFNEIIEQFRKTFPPEHLKIKDNEERKKDNGRDRWIPPFMVSWDSDSIDPSALPCTIAQERNGLSSEECLAFCDEIANTKKMALMEIIEFNPELWKGYLDEPIQMTLNDFIAGAYMNELQTPHNISGQRLDLQTSVKLLQDMIVRVCKTEKNSPDEISTEHNLKLVWG